MIYRDWIAYLHQELTVLDERFYLYDECKSGHAAAMLLQPFAISGRIHRLSLPERRHYAQSRGKYESSHRTGPCFFPGHRDANHRSSASSSRIRA